MQAAVGGSGRAAPLWLSPRGSARAAWAGSPQPPARLSAANPEEVHQEHERSPGGPNTPAMKTAHNDLGGACDLFDRSRCRVFELIDVVALLPIVLTCDNPGWCSRAMGYVGASPTVT